MPRTFSFRALWLTASVAIVLISFGERSTTAQAVKPVNADAANRDAVAAAGFTERVNQYVTLHNKLKSTLPKLPQEATPQQIDQNERALGALIQANRKSAQRGDIFTPEISVIIKRVMAQIFSGPEGQKLRSSVMDENVKELPLRVNQRFPEVPMATMPPAVLKALPPMPEHMEYRFVASQFVLLDVQSNLVVDFIPAVLPTK